MDILGKFALEYYTAVKNNEVIHIHWLSRTSKTSVVWRKNQVVIEYEIYKLDIYKVTISTFSKQI